LDDYKDVSEGCAVSIIFIAAGEGLESNDLSLSLAVMAFAASADPGPNAKEVAAAAGRQDKETRGQAR